MEKQIRVLIGGLGNAGRPMIDLFISEQSRIARDYGIHFQIIGVADSKGAAICPDGIPYEHIAQAKDHCGTVAMISGNGHPQMTALQMIEACDADIYVDGLPPFLPTGEPGTSNIRAALQKGMHVVTANKAPLALHWKSLFQLADAQGLCLRYGTAASSGLPTLEMGKLLGQCGELLEFSGIFNASCMYIINELKNGSGFDTAVAGAREKGFLEPNASMDIDGWDTAMKTVIQANTYWGTSYSLSDVKIQGIRELTKQDIDEATARQEAWCMVGHAVMTASGLELHAAPERLPVDHPLARARWCDKVLWMKTRTQGEQVHYCLGASASSTPGNMFADLLTIARKIV